MDPAIAARFHGSILAAALPLYDIAPDAIHLLDGFESFLYEFDRPDGAYILRLGHSLRRSADLIRGEVDWINYLAAGGATVAQAILSAGGNLVEPLADGQGGHFLATAFRRAPGGPLRRAQWGQPLFLNYGRLLGRMHALSQSYTLPDPAWKRPEWDDPANKGAAELLSPRETAVWEQYRRLREHLAALPRDRAGYGMIHQDAHTGNLFVDDNLTLTLFDFDDCVYGHFIYDLAMVLFYAASMAQDPVAFTAGFMPPFLRGYREENHLAPAWLPELAHFLKLREIDLFAHIHHDFADGDNPDHSWCAHFMRGRRERIAEGVPVIDYDWASLAVYLE
jgi:Ser/Thr protein kinase RdoA (MazF antagonist)